MGVLGTVVHVHVLNEATADAVLGEHAFEHTEEQGVHTGFEVLVEGFLHEHFGSEFALTAGVAGEVEVDAVGELFAGEGNLFSVDDYNVVAAKDVGRVGGFVLAAEDFGNDGAQTTQGNVGGIDEHPFALNALSVGGDGFVT